MFYFHILLMDLTTPDFLGRLSVLQTYPQGHTNYTAAPRFVTEAELGTHQIADILSSWTCRHVHHHFIDLRRYEII